MRKSIIAAAMIAMIAATAAQAETAIGRILSLDRGATAVTLTNGSTYDFRDSEFVNTLHGFRPGDSVSVVYSEGTGGTLVGEAISGTSGFHAGGQITAIDAGTGNVTLSDGRTIMFPQGTEGHAALGGFNTGDNVTVAYQPAQGQLVGQSIGGSVADGMTGVIGNIHMGNGTFTINGQQVRLDPSRNFESVLGGYRDGDTVHAIIRQANGGMLVESLSPVTN